MSSKNKKAKKVVKKIVKTKKIVIKSAKKPETKKKVLSKSITKKKVNKSTVIKKSAGKKASRKIKVKLVGPISPKVVASFRGKKKKYYEMLMALRANILGQVKFLSEEALASGATTGEHSSTMTNHLADYGSDNFLHNMELDIMTGEMEDLEMIDEALQRLANDEYGKCFDCGCQIPEGRLNVKPHARFCVKCKSKREENSEKIEFER
ncbi:MAG TPA: TraR/DksA family transcriptional regulator [Victivallales bacterium]|nr:TraR/DksA family transcriptional regulator [Victivallales bacterium]